MVNINHLPGGLRIVDVRGVSGSLTANFTFGVRKFAMICLDRVAILILLKNC